MNCLWLLVAISLLIQTIQSTSNGPSKALILVGGFGTRLRPLTFSVPKPLVSFANKPMIQHQIEELARVGVKYIVLAMSYHCESMIKPMSQLAADLNIEIDFSVESEPMDTAGPLALAKSKLMRDSNSMFVFNSDVMCDFNLKQMIEFHQNHAGSATILTTKVEDPSKYGVIISDTDGLVQKFAEKPTVFVGDQINAGVYLLDMSVLDQIPLRRCSIERETFPLLASQNQLYSMPLTGFWMDVGQPHDYIKGQALFLKNQLSTSNVVEKRDLEGEYTVIEPVLISESARIGRGAVVGPNVVIGKDVVVEEFVRLQDAAVFDGSLVRSGAFVKNSIIGWKSVVGAWTHLDNVTVLGEDVSVSDGLVVNGAKVMPHKGIKESIMQPVIVM